MEHTKAPWKRVHIGDHDTVEPVVERGKAHLKFICEGCSFVVSKPSKTNREFGRCDNCLPPTGRFEHEGENDYKLHGEGSVWITVNGVSVWIVPKGSGCVVEVYEKGKEADNPIDSIIAF